MAKSRDDGPSPGSQRSKGTERFAVAAIGGSAGGLEAFQRLVAKLPPDTGMAYVMILHLSPTHESALVEILSRSAQMPVREIQHGMAIEPNHIYVKPPAANVLFVGGRLELVPQGASRGVQHPIDHFMRSLAEGLGELSVGVVLSGTGNDGALGVTDIKAVGGITFAQDDSAQQTTMPRNAVASGAVDFALAPEAIADDLARIAAHLARPEVPHKQDDSHDAALRQLFEILRRETGIAFDDYRRNTIHRRILRRMALHRLERVTDYVQFVEGNDREIDALHRDILINVTSFFRDPQAFEAIQRIVFPQVTENKQRDDVVRVWVVGCSTGQDAYSIAMSHAEFVQATGRHSALQVFATDANGVSIQSARVGVYSKGIEQDVSPARLRDFFQAVDGSYRISRTIRDACIFARHDALSEPPFSRIDLVVCRNLLIYLEPVLQRRLLSTLHYALNPNGFLWLGNSETVNSFSEFFEVEDAKHRIYRRKPLVRAQVNFVASEPARRPSPRSVTRTTAEPDPHRDVERQLLARYAPPAVVVDTEMNVVQFRGDTSPFLVPPQGRASLNLYKMLREGLLVGVRGAVHRAERENKTVREEGLRVRGEDGEREVTIVAMSIREGDRHAGTVIVFEQPGEGSAAQARQVVDEKVGVVKPRTEKPREEAQRLRQELTATREYLQSVIEKLETANEELQAANEEAQSSNEELQSVNEELETSKEEIESTNEELTTVNEELQNRNLELTQSTNDLNNLLLCIQTPIVLLDRSLRIRLFTPAAQALMNLLPSDVGRPMSDIKLNVDVEDIEEILTSVAGEGVDAERETRDRSGRWQWLRAKVYRDGQGTNQGVILMLIDIDTIKNATQRVNESEARFAALADSAPVLLWVHGLSGCEFVNRAYEAFAGASLEKLRGLGWSEQLHPDDRERVLRTYREAFVSREPFEYVARLRRADGHYRWMKAIGAVRVLAGGEFAGFVGSSVDITDLKEGEESLRNADRAKNEFLAALAHELRNPLAAISNASYVLATQGGEAKPSTLAIIERQTRNMVRIVDDLLDVSRITHGKINLRLSPTDVEAVVRDASAATEHDRKHFGQTIHCAFPKERLWIMADGPRFEQILTNLLGNASKFAPTGGRIELAVTKEAGARGRSAVVLRVRDDGTGIDASVLPRVFELFVQGERTDDRARSGVGIGLALARHLVTLHGGTIEAHNLPDRGSEFVVRVPAVPAPALQPPSAESGGQAVTVRRVLVVDDNQDAAQAVTTVLELLGHQVRVAGSGREGIEVAREFVPDVMFIDIGLPDMDGHAVARRLREDERTRHVALVALTGYGRAEDEARAREAGFDLHLKKPAEPEELSRAIATAGRTGEAS